MPDEDLDDNDYFARLFDPTEEDRKFQGRQTDPGHVVGEVEVMVATAKAILVRGKLKADPFGTVDNYQEEWIPLSQLHADSDVRHKGDKGTLVITEWLAERKGLR